MGASDEPFFSYATPVDADNANAATEKLYELLNIQGNVEDAPTHTARFDVIMSCKYRGVQIFTDLAMVVDSPKSGIGIFWYSLRPKPLLADDVELKAAVRQAIVSVGNAPS